jgi:hypothetical protein
MAKILFAWECGGGIGHLTRYSQLIDQLLGEGQEVLFAVRSLASGAMVFAEKGVTLVQAPVRLERMMEGVPSPRSYLHVLKNQGFCHPQGLRGRYEAWLSLYEMWRPDLIIADHSPTAVLAAQCYTDAKLIVSGDGFTVPPEDYPFQAFPIAPIYSREVLLEEEQQFLDRHLNPLMRAVKGKPYNRLCDAFRASARWLCLFENMDHYPARQHEIYLGTGLSPAGEKPVWPAAQGSKIFAYLKPHKGLVELLQLLTQSRLPTLIYGDQLPVAVEQRFNSDTMHFKHTLQDMGQIARECHLGITNGSASASAQFLLAGKPVLMMPLHIEQLLMSKSVERMGAGIAVDYLLDEHFNYGDALEKLLRKDNSFQRMAQQFAQRHQSYQAQQLPSYMYEDIQRLLANHG